MPVPKRQKKASPLLRLPAELRSKIYLNLLSGHVIHIGGTGHQPYTEGHLPNGRCCACTASLTDEDCFAKYTAQGKPLKGTLPRDRFSARHRDCHRYPVSHRLPLSILSVCRSARQEASPFVFEENLFTLARPTSLGPFLSRLSPVQLKSIRALAVYSAESAATWIGPYNHYDLHNYLTGLQSLRICIELKPFDVRAFEYDGESIDWRVLVKRMSGLTMFKTPLLSEVDVEIMTPDWGDVEAEDLSNDTVEALKSWEMLLKDMLLQTSADEAP